MGGQDNKSIDDEMMVISECTMGRDTASINEYKLNLRTESSTGDINKFNPFEYPFVY